VPVSRRQKGGIALLQTPKAVPFGAGREWRPRVPAKDPQGSNTLRIFMA
jgi:hypothetical protein